MSNLQTSRIIQDAFTILGVYGAGVELSGEDVDVGLGRFQDMLDSWNTERLFIYTVQEYSVAGVFPTLPAGGTGPDNISQITIGPGAFINVPERPTQIDDWVYVVYNQVSYPVVRINKEQFQSITLKSQTSSFPQYWYYDANYPVATMYFWPQPVVPTELHISFWKEFVSGVTIGATTMFPQGYSRALKYSLAEELESIYRVPLSVAARNIARKARKNIKRMNAISPVMGFRQELTGKRSTFNIYTGE